MDYIFGLIGKSGSGKTSVAKALQDDYNVLLSYTTRMPRHPGEYGHTFISETQAYRIMKKETVIAHAMLYDYCYFATRKQVKGPTIYIIDPASYLTLKRLLPDVPMTSIYLSVSEPVIYQRLLNSRSLEEVRIRVRKDANIFKDVKADYTVSFDGLLYEQVRLVKKIIEDKLLEATASAKDNNKQ